MATPVRNKRHGIGSGLADVSRGPRLNPSTGFFEHFPQHGPRPGPRNPYITRRFPSASTLRQPAQTSSSARIDEILRVTRRMGELNQKTRLEPSEKQERARLLRYIKNLRIE